MPVVLRSHRRASVALAAVLAAALAAAVLAAAPAQAEPVPPGYTYTDAWFASRDGTRLHVGIFLPADREPGERHPVLMDIGPYTAPNGGATGGNLTGIVDRNPEIWDHEGFRAGRWAVLQVDARGFGGSEGCFEYYMPNEALDAAAAIEWAAAQPWSTGRVGMWGKSYDAAQQVLALASDPEGLAATVIQAPGLSAYTALWDDGVHYATGRYGTTGVYTADDLAPPQNLDTIGSPDYARAMLAPATSVPGNPTCRTDALVGMNTVADREDPFWEGREAYLGAISSDVPTFFVQGFWDANTKPEHLPVWSSLTGPKRAWFGQWDHIRANEPGVGRRASFLDEAFRFLDEHVRGIEPAVDDPPIAVERGNDGVWREEQAWPPADAEGWSMPLNPGTYRDLPEAAGASATSIWSVSPALPSAAHLAGEPVLDVTTEELAPWTHLVGRVYDVDPDGRARLVTRGAQATAAVGREERTTTLYPQDWVFEEGHRIAVRISASDDAWYSPGVTGTDVEILSGTLELPLLRVRRDDTIEGDPSKGGPASFALPAGTVERNEVDVDPPPAQEDPPGA